MAFLGVRARLALLLALTSVLGAGGSRVSVHGLAESLAGSESDEERVGMEDRLGVRLLEWDRELAANVSARIAVGEASSHLEMKTDDKKYTHVQFVGLSMYTYPEGMGKMGMQAFYTGINHLVETNMGAVVNNVHDAQARVDVMKQMMDVAHASKHVNTNPDVLKVFIAPEFFFRGPHGAYNMLSLDGCSNEDSEETGVCNAPILTILTQLKDEVKKDKWEDWLFAFGTIVSVVHGKKSHYWNFAPVMRGGPKNAACHHIVAKSYVSGIDFLDCSQEPDEQKKRICHAHPSSFGIGRYDLFKKKQKKAIEKMGFELQEDNVFDVNNIRFGMEVCLDHSMQVLQETLEDEDDYIDVHLVTSAGMSITWNAAGDGPIFLQDGGSNGAPSSYECRSCKYLGEGSTEAEGYGTPEVIASPGMHAFSEQEKLASTFTTGEEVSTARADDVWYSKFGFATEGTGLGVDPRFRQALVDGLFATDDYKPQINVGPAFALPVRGKHADDADSGGCDDKEFTGYFILGKPATCASLEAYCRAQGMMENLGSHVRAKCPVTCDVC
mmetsp:Transcript_9538/g.25906  ORF Transcript_9538/g.25906 Transcript_9538/m.25906 type:complete len:554 (-) Transcript_9538:94-1755(-)